MSAAEWELIDEVRRSPKSLGAGRVSGAFTAVVSSGTALPASTVSFSIPMLFPPIVNSPHANSNTASQLINFDIAMQGNLKVTGFSVSPLVEQFDETVKRAHSAIDELISPLLHGSLLAPRLHELIDLAKDEYPDTDIPTYTSIATLRRFLVEYPGVTPPDLSLLPSGSLWLSWRRYGVNAGLSIFRDGAVSFGLLVPGGARPTHINFAGTLQSVAPRIAREDSARGILN